MTVAEAQARMTQAEFIDWQLWFEWRNDMAERQRLGMPMHDSDAADELTPDESAKHVQAIFGQLAARPNG